MPGYKIVVNPIDVVYVYDGSIAGFLTCIHTSFYSKQMPANIQSEDAYEPSLYEQRYIQADQAKAAAVRQSIIKNISKRALELVDCVFLCHHKNKDLALLNFLIIGFRVGAGVTDMRGEKEVADVIAMERHFAGEQHLLLGFLRFKDYGNMLGAVISPKNFVLPFLAEHFVSRFPNENFIIYCQTYKAALIYQDKKLEFANIEEIDFADDSEEELHYQNLWKNFYKTIGIKERLNPKCRMSHMPKRYWKNMTEMKEFL